MRIAMLIEAWKPIWAGGQIHVWELCQRLAAKHHCEIDLFVMNLKSTDEPSGNNGNTSNDGPREEKKYPAEEVYFNGRLRLFRVGRRSSFDFISRVSWCREVNKAIISKHRDKKYDLIHAHANLPGFPARELSRKLKIPVVFTVHGCGLEAITNMYGHGPKSWFLYHLEKYLQTKNKYDCEITVDSSFLKHPNVNRKIAVIPNGVDLDRFKKSSTPKSKKFKIVWVGRLHPQKGLTYLLDALNQIKSQLSGVEVHLIGSGPLEKSLREKSRVLGLEKIVKFRGKIYGDNLVKEYQSSHLFILPSLYEGQPLTLLEAWAAKLPVLVTNVGGNKDFVTDGKNGYLFPPRKAKVLAQTLLTAINSPKLKEMGERGYNLVKNNYAWDRTAEKTFSIYQSLLNRDLSQDQCVEQYQWK